VTIGLVDDCLEITHPDLAPNYVAADSWDFGQNDPDPSPVTASDGHGTSVAGLAAGRGGNGIGISGAAPLANLSCQRIDFDNQTEQMFADATLYHACPGNTSIAIKNHSYGTFVPFEPTALEAAALRISASVGTIHTFAAGNERQYHGLYVYDVNHNGVFDPDVDLAIDADANKKQDQAVPEVITVAALGADGRFAPYSNWGANVFVTAPSSGALGLAITTTDRTGADGYDPGDYTNAFGGTSAATPVVAGILALGKQVNPAMDWRLAKHLLVRTSTHIDPTDHSDTSDGGWKTNAAGFQFNQDYGFGLINADAFTRLAARCSGVTPQMTETTGTISVNEAIIFSGGNTQMFAFAQPGEIEEVAVHLDITHTWRGDLTAYLTSPSGTVCRLFKENLADTFDIIDWTFVANTFWGESPVGAWSLRIDDTYPWSDNGTWNSFSATVTTGSLVPEPATLALLGAGALLAVLRRRCLFRR
jgi:subtilisin-like proprotein convertase family protein